MSGGWPGESAGIRRPSQSPARQRAFRSPGLDAGDDGHDPGPGAERGHGGRASRADGGPGLRSGLPAAVPSDVPRDRRLQAPEDPWQQLRGAVEAVFRSWNGDRARAYRAHEGIADDLGTGVTVQAMVFGNRGADSGTGVLFTRSPATGERALYGDVMFQAQGEDVVAGTHKPQPLAILDSQLPAVAAELRRYATCWSATTPTCATSSSPSSRASCGCSRCGSESGVPRAALRIAVEMAQDPDFPCSREEAVRRTARYLANPPLVFLARPAVRRR